MPAPIAPHETESRTNGDRAPNRRVVHDIVSASTNASSIGIDTVRIRVEQFSIESSADFTIYEKANHSTGKTSNVPLWRQPSSEAITGNRATLNTDLAQITVRGPEYMSVQSSLPKVLFGENVRPVSTTKEFCQALSELEAHLRENGIRCRLINCPIDRVDICRNVRTDAAITDFKESLRELSAPYLSARDNGYEGMKWNSSQGGSSAEREITLYNKSKEAGLEEPNIQRLEYRLQRRRAVESQLGQVSTTELREGLTLVRSAFREIVEELFPEPPPNLESVSSSSTSPPQSQTAENGNSSPQITSSDIRPVLAAIRSDNGSSCHSLNRMAWVLLWVISQQPRQLCSAFKRAAGSEVGPSNGKYSVRDKMQEARSYACMLDADLKTEDQRLARLREKLLS